ENDENEKETICFTTENSPKKKEKENERMPWPFLAIQHKYFKSPSVPNSHAIRTVSKYRSNFWRSSLRTRN
ncbi:hypothetical protein LOAG_19087, partial [Loa loa]